VRLLIVEDERRLAERLARGLREEGLAVDLAATAAEARERAEESAYDAILLDLGLPDGDGLAQLRSWRDEGLVTPVLVLTARDRTEEKVAGLDAGADDYLTKPFEFDELLARLRALLRRPHAPPTSVLRFADLSLDRNERAAYRGSRKLALTAKELALLEYFLLRPGAARTRSEIAESVWDSGYEARSNVVDVIVGRLRRKLEERGEPRLLHGRPGLGWALEARLEADE
jgi:DNA-binding response OmpR family regulator